ncbi:hypothetical protein INT48_009138 [Thamnidium elegans]|uniref:Cytochrome b5 heme-binding domain-containing protein n=1 Tax=Thamnidium elegans TaxID=101142 RepID=A0A8H7SX17_9FUNG|nr:hypothetical protein INT48_009138 [Thamnidium elegans]
MDDDTIEYFFDNVDSFYAGNYKLDDVLNRPYSTEEDVQRITTQYIRFLTRYQQQFLKSSVEFAQVAYKLIDSKLCLDFSTVVLGHILNNHALVSQDITELLVSYSLLLYAGKDEPRWMNYILLESIHKRRNRLFSKIVTEVRLDLLDTLLINHFLDLVEETRGDSDESFNYDVIRLIMVLNEQYMMSGLNENLVLDVLSKRMGISDTFSANLIFMLNRSNDTCVQMLILKLLYGIFTTPTLYEYFYTNDLYVLVDITLRELCDLGDTKESQTLRLRPYKKQETYKTLNSLLNPGMQRKVNSTTKRIVNRIIENWWEKLCGYYNDNVDSPNLSHNSTLSSCSSSSGPSTPNDVDEISVIIPRKDVIARKTNITEIKEKKKSSLLSSGLLALTWTLLFFFLGSYLITESWTWGYRGKWTNINNYIPRQELIFTDAELAQYDGTDRTKPIYLAIDGDVYDVSQGAGWYGKGGSYHHFAGKDAARAYVTGCFEDHLTHDVRGLTSDQLKGLDHWKKFYDSSHKYHKVGRVLHDPIPEDAPIPKPCKTAVGQKP